VAPVVAFRHQSVCNIAGSRVKWDLGLLEPLTELQENFGIPGAWTGLFIHWRGIDAARKRSVKIVDQY
jgi:hypothetical protein